MINNQIVQVKEDVLNTLAGDIYTMISVTKFAETIAVDMSPTTDTYIEMRIRAFEGIFNLLTVKLQDLEKQITEVLNTEYENRRKEE